MFVYLWKIRNFVRFFKFFHCHFTSLLQNASPNPSNGVSHRVPPERPPKPKFSPKPQNGLYPKITSKTEVNDESSDRDYEVLSPNARIRPTRPAPQPPTAAAVGSVPIYGTLPGSSDLDGVPFVLNSMLSFHTESWVVSFSIHISQEFFRPICKKCLQVFFFFLRILILLSNWQNFKKLSILFSPHLCLNFSKLTTMLRNSWNFRFFCSHFTLKTKFFLLSFFRTECTSCDQTANAEGAWQRGNYCDELSTRQLQRDRR